MTDEGGGRDIEEEGCEGWCVFIQWWGEGTYSGGGREGDDGWGVCVRTYTTGGVEVALRRHRFPLRSRHRSVPALDCAQVVSDKHEDTMTKFGAIIATGVPSTRLPDYCVSLHLNAFPFFISTHLFCRGDVLRIAVMCSC